MGYSGQKTKGALAPISQAYEIQLCAGHPEAARVAAPPAPPEGLQDVLGARGLGDRELPGGEGGGGARRRHQDLQHRDPRAPRRGGGQPQATEMEAGRGAHFNFGSLVRFHRDFFIISFDLIKIQIGWF